MRSCEVNQILSQLCHERNIYLIHHSKKIKTNHLNKDKLHLNKNGSDILSSTFVNEISRVFNWRVADNNSSINIKGCYTRVLHDINKVIVIILWSPCAKIVSLNLFLLIWT